MDSFDESHEPLNKRKRSPWKKYIFVVIGIIIGFIIGILIGKFGLCTEEVHTNGVFLSGVPASIIQDADPTISQEIMSAINPDNIRQYLRELSENPHLAGTPADWQQADELRQFWKDNGLDDVFISEYDVLLSYPNTTDEKNMNQIQIISDQGDIIYSSPLYEPILHPSENKSNVVPPFNAYSAPGIVESDELIYVNYGRVTDYRYLESINVNVSGKIVIARYGKIFRGDKTRHASANGAIGIILYSDPADYAVGQTDKTQVYPHDWWLPPSGVQRGSLMLVGDPLTPGYPAIETAYRLDEADPEAGLPSIPTHPIGYGIAERILSEMTGDVVPEDWKGAIQNTTYKLGGKLRNSSWKVKMRISTKNEKRKTYNVIGIIRGAVEPDRYVLLGNHRDAWVFGAIDPSSGTAVMKEVSRVMGSLVKLGRWRPRRTIIFCNWAAEEYGLIGSTEWVEQYVKNLAERSVAYLNVDMALEGNYSFRAKSTPLLIDSIYLATKKVPNPDPSDGFKTVYDKWRHAYPKDGNDPSTVPYIMPIGSGSDYKAMIQLVGLPSCDMRFTYDKKKYSLSSYPLYHSKYETFFAVDQIMDKGFKHHQAIGRVWAEMARHLSDEMILPLNVETFANEINDLMLNLENQYSHKLRSQGINFGHLKNVVKKLSKEAEKFTNVVKTVDKNNPLAVRHINDQLMLFERAFLDPQGLPGRPYARHIIFAESSTNTYAGSSFPGLVDSLFETERDPDQKGRWKAVKRHFSVILFTFESAIATLRDVTKFMPDFVKSNT